MHRFSATKRILSLIGKLPIVSNLGPTTDELWHAGHRDRNFYTYGSMGLCSSIALGMALSTDEKVISLDGDGSLLMNMGTIATIGRESPPNLIVIVWDNEQWAQTGNQASHTAFCDRPGRGRAGLRHLQPPPRWWTKRSWSRLCSRLSQKDGPWFIVAKIVEEEYLPVAPIEPELTLYRFRESFGA